MAAKKTAKTASKKTATKKAPAAKKAGRATRTAKAKATASTRTWRDRETIAANVATVKGALSRVGKSIGDIVEGTSLQVEIVRHAIGKLRAAGIAAAEGVKSSTVYRLV